MYGKKIYREYPSEWGAEIDRHSREFAHKIASLVMHKQWGIFYYEPASEEEARLMINKFEEKINELKEKYECMDIVDTVEKKSSRKKRGKKVSTKNVKKRK